MPDAIYGNLAHGLDNTAVRERVRSSPAQPKRRSEAYPDEVTTGQSSRSKEKSKVKVAPRQGVSTFAAFGTLCVAALFVLVLLSMINLTELSNKASELNSEMSTLTAQEEKLLVKYESAFDLNEVERFAVVELGMVKVGPNQIRYIQRECEDRAVVIKQDDKDGGILGSAANFLSRLASYFK